MSLVTRILTILALSAFSQTVLADIDPDSFPSELRALEWREVGPYRGGRSAAVTGIPGDEQTYYMGTTGGGVWKTLDAGQSWQNVSDGYFGGSIGSVAVSEWDNNVVYVGTGEKTVRGNVSPGEGMWKSTDAGDTWSRAGLDDAQHIARVRIHPKNPDVAYAAVMGHLFGPNSQRGVFRTTDGGASWERVLFVNEDTGAVDLIMDPTNPRILYAGMWRVRRTPYSLSSGGEGSGLYKSVDGGSTWENLTNNEGLPTGTVGIVGVTVSPTNNQNIYAMIESEKGGLFRSRDAGKTWAKVNEERKLRQRAWYYTRLYADPVDQDSVYVLNVRFHYSKDGGKSFSAIGVPHGDNHDLWIDPANPLRMIQANDGGSNVSFDRGATWSAQSNQPTAQMYRVSTDNAFPYRLLGGQQDNSAVRIRSRSARGRSIGVRDWEPTAGGESGHISAKPDDPDIVIGGSYDGFLIRFDHRTSERQAINVWPDNPMGWGAAELKYRFQWNFPLEFSIHNPERMYAAGNVLFISDDMGDSWQAISPDLTRNDKSRMGPSGGPITKDNTSVEYYGTIFALAQSRTDEGVIWAGSDDGLVHVTRDGGENWENVTPRGLPEWTQVNMLEAHPFEEGGAYLTATSYKSDDFRPYLYKTTNWGKSWKKITNGIPDSHFTRALRADPDRPGLLYAGTERGIYYSTDDGKSWSSLQLNLPIVPITDLAVKEKDLVAATQGRGYWILDDLSVLHQLNKKGSSASSLYKPRDSYRYIAGSRRDSPGDAGTNSYNGVNFFYEIGRDVSADTEVTLAVFESGSDEAIWSWSRKPAGDDGEEKKPNPNGMPDTAVLTTDVGLNRHNWDLTYPGMERFKGLIMWGDMEEGPTAVPGMYRATLSIGGKRQDVSFKVLADPRSSATPDDFAAQFAFVKEARDLLTRTHKEIVNLRQLRAQLTSLSGRAETDVAISEELAASISELMEKLDPIEKALYQTQNESRQDPLNFPIRLNDKLSAVMSLTAMGDAAPTKQALAVKQELSSAIEIQLAALAAIWRNEVPALNQRIKSAGVDLLKAASD
ncbi:MAG: WD40/YVTN/BNR-like repeat-containing protein [Gammaproteobacteria bacterium]